MTGIFATWQLMTSDLICEAVMWQIWTFYLPRHNLKQLINSSQQRENHGIHISVQCSVHLWVMHSSGLVCKTHFDSHYVNAVRMTSSHETEMDTQSSDMCHEVNETWPFVTKVYIQTVKGAMLMLGFLYAFGLSLFYVVFKSQTGLHVVCRGSHMYHRTSCCSSAVILQDEVSQSLCAHKAQFVLTDALWDYF